MRSPIPARLPGVAVAVVVNAPSVRSVLLSPPQPLTRTRTSPSVSWPQLPLLQLLLLLSPSLRGVRGAVAPRRPPVEVAASVQLQAQQPPAKLIELVRGLHGRRPRRRCSV